MLNQWLRFTFKNKSFSSFVEKTSRFDRPVSFELHRESWMVELDGRSVQSEDVCTQWFLPQTRRSTDWARKPHRVSWISSIVTNLGIIFLSCKLSFIEQACSVKMAEYWPFSRSCFFFSFLMYLNSIWVHQNVKAELGQYRTILFKTWTNLRVILPLFIIFNWQDLNYKLASSSNSVGLSMGAKFWGNIAYI